MRPVADVEHSPLPGQRPYRSHKIRACDYCRKRKQRCLVEVMGQSCHLCRLQEIPCSYTKGVDPLSGHSKLTSEGRDRHSPGPSILKRSYDEREDPPGSRSGSPQVKLSKEPRLDPASDTLDQSTHMVGPVVSKDAHVLEQYMSPGSPKGHRTTENPYSVYSADPHMPVLYTKVERRRQGLLISQEAGTKEKEIIEQILAPDGRRLFHLYAPRHYIK